MNFLDKDMETQVIGRVNRIGKKTDLNINNTILFVMSLFYDKK